MWPQVPYVVLISTFVAATASPIVTSGRDSRFLLFNHLMSQFHHQQRQEQQFPFFYKTPQTYSPAFHHPEPIDRMPEYNDYPGDSWHPPEPEPEPFNIRYFAPQPQPQPQPEPEQPLPQHNPFVTTTYTYSLRDNNNLQTPSEQLQPPKAAGPIRIFFLFSRFPWPLEPVVQRVQNYFSTYAVPTVEPILDEEVDLGPEPVVEEVDDIESQLAVITTTTEPPKIDETTNNITANRISLNGTTEVQPDNKNSTNDELRNEETATELSEDESTTTESSVPDETTSSEEETTTSATTEEVKDESTTIAANGDKNEKNVSAITTSEMPSPDYDEVPVV